MEGREGQGFEAAPAFAFWGGDFWFFPPNGSVVRYKYASDQTFETVLPADMNMNFIGAASSTCAPLVP